MPDSVAPLVAVAGCGYWGRNLVRNFAELGALAAVVDAQSDRAAEFGTRYGVPGRDWASVLDDPDIDAVALATPAERHAAMALEALAHGKHVFVEKPLALTVADGERVAAVASAANRTVMVGHLLQYHPAFLSWRAGAGRRGRRIRVPLFQSAQPRPHPARGERLLEFRPHDLSVILALAGEPPTKVGRSAALSASQHRRRHDDASGVRQRHPRAHLRVVAAPVQGAEAGRGRRRRHGGVRRRPAGSASSPCFGTRSPGATGCRSRTGRRRSRSRSIGRAAGTGMPALPRLCPHQCATRTDAAEALAVLRVLAAAEMEMRTAGPAALVSTADTAGVFVHESAFVDHGCELGEGTRVWHFSHLLGGVRIGRHCVIGQNAMIGPDVAVGDHCKIQNNVSLYRGVTLEDGVFYSRPACSPMFSTRAEIERKNEFRATLVRRGATIGANATIVCGRTLGEYCFAAAGAVRATCLRSPGRRQSGAAHRLGQPERRAPRA